MRNAIEILCPLPRCHPAPFLLIVSRSAGDAVREELTRWAKTLKDCVAPSMHNRRPAVSRQFSVKSEQWAAIRNL